MINVDDSIIIKSILTKLEDKNLGNYLLGDMSSFSSEEAYLKYITEIIISFEGYYKLLEETNSQRNKRFLLAGKPLDEQIDSLIKIYHKSEIATQLDASGAEVVLTIYLACAFPKLAQALVSSTTSLADGIEEFSKDFEFKEAFAKHLKGSMEITPNPARSTVEIETPKSIEQPASSSSDIKSEESAKKQQAVTLDVSATKQESIRIKEVQKVQGITKESQENDKREANAANPEELFEKKEKTKMANDLKTAVIENTATETEVKLSEPQIKVRDKMLEKISFESRQNNSRNYKIQFAVIDGPSKYERAAANGSNEYTEFVTKEVLIETGEVDSNNQPVKELKKTTEQKVLNGLNRGWVNKLNETTADRNARLDAHMKVVKEKLCKTTKGQYLTCPDGTSPADFEKSVDSYFSFIEELKNLPDDGRVESLLPSKNESVNGFFVKKDTEVAQLKNKDLCILLANETLGAIAYEGDDDITVNLKSSTSKKSKKNSSNKTEIENVKTPIISIKGKAKLLAKPNNIRLKKMTDETVDISVKSEVSLKARMTKKVDGRYTVKPAETRPKKGSSSEMVTIYPTVTFRAPLWLRGAGIEADNSLEASFPGIHEAFKKSTSDDSSAETESLYKKMISANADSNIFKQFIHEITAIATDQADFAQSLGIQPETGDTSAAKKPAVKKKDEGVKADADPSLV